MAEFLKRTVLEIKLKEAINDIVDMFDVDRCSLMLLGENNSLEIAASQGISNDIIKNTRIKFGEGISGLVMKEGKAMLIKSIDSEKSGKISKSQGLYKTSSFISFPVKVRGNIIGVINITDKKSNSPFDEKDLSALQSVADEIAKLVSKEYIL